MTENELRAKYRAAKIEASLECGGPKAAEMAKRTAYLTDTEFESYAAQAASDVAGLKAWSGVPGAEPLTKQEPDHAKAERVQASVAAYIGNFLNIPEDDEPSEDDKAR